MTFRLLSALLVLAALATWLGAAEPAPSTASPATPALQITRPVDLVICLDTSGSMEDLLDATRARIWDVVNTLGKLAPTPELRVGLISFGTERSNEEEGWLVLESDLSGELDLVYGKLMALTVAGGEEYVGRALMTAIEEMDWSRDPDALKVIFVAGNESADQAVETHDFRKAARWALDDGIIVNALYAGNRDQGVVELWPELARRGNGNFSAIDPERSTIQIATPQDEPLLTLNARLNETYLPYGPDGEKGLANQVAQDGNASRLGVQSCSARIVAKGSALYNNASWDLVDAVGKGIVDVGTMHSDDLPAALRSLSADERLAQVEAMRSAREGIQLEIQELSGLREEHVKAVLAKERMERGLDEAMKQALVDQAKAKGFKCEGC